MVDHRFERFDDRLGRLEADVKEIKADIKELGRRLGGEIKSVEQRLARLEGVVSNLPSTWVTLTAIAASQVTLLGLAFLILRYAPR